MKKIKRKIGKLLVRQDQLSLFPRFQRLFRSLLITVLWVLVAVFLWWFMTDIYGVDRVFLPPLSEVINRLGNGIGFGEESLLLDLAMTLGRASLGFGIALAVGIPLGLFIGRTPFLADIFQPGLDFFRSIPATALFPLFLLFFGIGDTAKVMVVVYASSLIVIVNTAYGAMKVKTTRLLSASVIGANRWDVFWKIIVPETAPEIFAGARIALSLSFVLVVVTEMFIGTTVGLGFRITNAPTHKTDEMFSAIILTGLIGYLTNRMLLFFERRYLHWIGT
jgi:NitT/TauT family transport system permease protein